MWSTSIAGHQEVRIIGRKREYNTRRSAYDPWCNITITNVEKEKQIPLCRGGKLVFRPNVLSEAEQSTLAAVMQRCRLFRQYSFGATYREPRSHVLLSSKIKSDEKHTSNSPVQPGYVYHGICMKAYPLDLVPEVEQLANRLARLYDIQEWNTGVDMLAYKDGEDRIGWHSDDTQGEALVVCVVVSCKQHRPLHIRPKKSATTPLNDGDEQIEIYPGEGDAYDMDGVMQLGYEHSLPKKTKTSSHRFAIVFRNGNEGFVSEDSGEQVISMSPPKHFSRSSENQLHYSYNNNLDLVSLLKKVRYKHPSVTFGPAECLQEGSCYDRRFLYTTFTHRSDQRGINGNSMIGSDSIVVSRQSAKLREKDGIGWLLYTSTRKQGALGLCRTHANQMPVRVFRSSRLDNMYSPPPFSSKSNQKRTSYRYDGLYLITKVFDQDGHVTKILPVQNEQYTFFLARLNVKENSINQRSFEHLSVFEPHNKEQYWNNLSTKDLCRIINDSRPHTETNVAIPRPYPLFDRLPRLLDVFVESMNENPTKNALGPIRFQRFGLSPSRSSTPSRNHIMSKHRLKEKSKNIKLKGEGMMYDEDDEFNEKKAKCIKDASKNAYMLHKRTMEHDIKESVSGNKNKKPNTKKRIITIQREAIYELELFAWQIQKKYFSSRKTKQKFVAKRRKQHNLKIVSVKVQGIVNARKMTTYV